MAVLQTDIPASALQRKPACACGGGCPRCQAKESKLEVGAPDSVHEREADRVADAVLRMPDAVVQRQIDEDEDETIQAKSESGAPTKATPDIDAQVAGLRGRGAPLPAAERAFFEPRFGRDFSTVRVHAGPDAAQAARGLSARAFTVGSNIAFGAGQYTPGTTDGRRLLAHELTHVVQSTGSHGAAGATIMRAAEDRTGAAPTAEADRPAEAQFDEACDERMRCQANEALKAARIMVGSAITALGPVVDGSVTTGPVVDLLNEHFHTSSASDAKTIFDNFVLIQGELNASITYRCGQGTPACKSEEGITGASTSCAARADVVLCALFFLIGPECRGPASLLIHELAHHVPGICEDKAYVDEPAYKTLPPAMALINADSYGQFAFQVHTGSITCAKC